MEFKNKTALITGSTSGIGLAIARNFASKGANIVLNGFGDAKEIELLRSNMIKEYGVKCNYSDANMLEPEQIRKMVSDAIAEFGAVDILVNNAGLALGLEPAHKADLSDWDRMIDTNIKGLVHMTRALLPGMVERKLGHVINLGSVAANYPYPGGNTYGATKAFVQQFSLNLRADLVGTPIRVTCIEPGMCSGTEFSNVRFKGDDAKAGNVYEGVHALSADEIAETIYWSATLPSHMNINVLEVMPVQQSFSAFQIHRSKL